MCAVSPLAMHYFTYRGSFLTSANIIASFPKATAHNPFNFPFIGLWLSPQAWKLRSVLLSTSPRESSISFLWVPRMSCVSHRSLHLACSIEILWIWLILLEHNYALQVGDTIFVIFTYPVLTTIPDTYMVDIQNTIVELSWWKKHYAQSYSFLKT